MFIPNGMQTGRYFIGTLSVDKHPDPPCLKEGLVYIRGQQEKGEGGFLHWQFIAVTAKKARISWMARLFPTGHFELTRSKSAMEYVWKESTRIEGTQFEHGTLVSGEKGRDWDSIKRAAIEGKLENVPPDVYVRYYNSLRRIGMDSMQPVAMERSVTVYHGLTGVGKSRKAWGDAGLSAYPKSPTTKFWDGYCGQDHVVIDEFRGAIGIEHLLRWFDRYPVCVETKGSGTVLKATKIWITSNLHPDLWYPTMDDATKDALKRRLKIVEILNFSQIKN